VSYSFIPYSRRIRKSQSQSLPYGLEAFSHQIVKRSCASALTHKSFTSGFDQHFLSYSSDLLFNLDSRVKLTCLATV